VQSVACFPFSRVTICPHGKVEHKERFILDQLCNPSGRSNIAGGALGQLTPRRGEEVFPGPSTADDSGWPLRGSSPGREILRAGARGVWRPLAYRFDHLLSQPTESCHLLPSSEALCPMVTGRGARTGSGGGFVGTFHSLHVMRQLSKVMALICFLMQCKEERWSDRGRGSGVSSVCPSDTAHRRPKIDPHRSAKNRAGRTSCGSSA
jgi:hypothetical protein